MEKTGESYQQALRQVRVHVRPNVAVDPRQRAEATASAESVGGTVAAGLVHLAKGPLDPNESGALRSLRAPPRLHVVDAKEIASKLSAHTG